MRKETARSSRRLTVCTTDDEQKVSKTIFQWKSENEQQREGAALIKTSWKAQGPRQKAIEGDGRVWHYETGRRGQGQQVKKGGVASTTGSGNVGASIVQAINQSGTGKATASGA